VAAPTNDVSELAGPEPLRLADLGRRVLEHRHDPRTVVTDPDAGYFGGVVTDRSLTPGNDQSVAGVRLAPTRFDAWLSATADES
jgi:uncharacterized protein YbjT (DUF2867 family)